MSKNRAEKGGKREEKYLKRNRSKKSKKSKSNRNLNKTNRMISKSCNQKFSTIVHDRVEQEINLLKTNSIKNKSLTIKKNFPNKAKTKR